MIGEDKQLMIKGTEGLSFKLSFAFPSNYPYSPPTVMFTTPIFHPNIDMAGRICLDILKDKWSAVYNVQSILLSLQSLLGEPNTKSPLNGQAAELWDKNPTESVCCFFLLSNKALLT